MRIELNDNKSNAIPESTNKSIGAASNLIETTDLGPYRKWSAPEFVLCNVCGNNRRYFGPGAASEPKRKPKRRWSWLSGGDDEFGELCPSCGAI